MSDFDTDTALTDVRSSGAAQATLAPTSAVSPAPGSDAGTLVLMLVHWY